jgi:hypothetical protein
VIAIDMRIVSSALLWKNLSPARGGVNAPNCALGTSRRRSSGGDRLRGGGRLAGTLVRGQTSRTKTPSNCCFAFLVASTSSLPSRIGGGFEMWPLAVKV